MAGRVGMHGYWWVWRVFEQHEGEDHVVGAFMGKIYEPLRWAGDVTFDLVGVYVTETAARETLERISNGASVVRIEWIPQEQ